MLVENKFLRVLIVMGNNILSLVMVPIQLIRLIVNYIRYKEYYNELDLGWTEIIKSFTAGLKRATHANRRFLRNGDLNEFDTDRLAYEVAEQIVNEMEDESV